MKYIISVFTSTRTMTVLLILFAVSIGWATFIENDYGTDGARSMVYNARWFEILLFLGLINIIGVTIKNKIYKKSKLTIFIFHIAFVVIIIGAGITRYFSREGSIHIREGETQNIWYTSKAQIGIELTANAASKIYSYPVLFSGISRNKFSEKFTFSGHHISVSLDKYIPMAEQSLSYDKQGVPYIHLVSTVNMGRENFFLTIGDKIKIGNVLLLFTTVDTIPRKDIISVAKKESGELKFIAPFDVSRTIMAEQITDTLKANIWHPFSPLTLYNFDGIPLVMSQYLPMGLMIPQAVESKEENLQSALIMDVKCDGNSKKVIVWGKKENIGNPASVELNGVKFLIDYGSGVYKLPFSLKLNDFILKRYPGSESPSWFESDVLLFDNNKAEEHRIFMNNILKHNGYRFYQSSYDPDEKGTILSINHDGLGTFVTYLGYLLMALGMILSLMNRNSRFRLLTKQMIPLVVVFILFSDGISAQDSIRHYNEKLPVIEKLHADKFGELLVQDNGGRIEPINTLASEVLRKVARKESYKEQSPDQVFLGMLVFPEIWQHEPMIRIGHAEIQKLLGINSNYASFTDFFSGDQYGGYTLKPYVEEAFRKKPAYRSKFDNEIIRTDERVNICYLVYTGTALNIFPAPNDPTGKWYSPVTTSKVFHGNDSLFVNLILTYYFDEINKSVKENDWHVPTELVNSIGSFQKKYGNEIIPSERHQKAENFYNKSNIFQRISTIYMLVGFILLLLQFLSIFVPRFKMRYITIVSIILISITFTFHLIGLALRWYIAGHAPWSNGYEALTYIAWVTILAGLIFSRKSGVTISVTAILASLILFTAHLSWMDPQITNLVPVLKSYWLVIHVATITASYAFLGMGALLSTFNLLLMFFESAKNKELLESHISRITAIIESTLIVGLYMLTVGTFLGGVWANESWGRYWAWDPKETWALVTVIIYAIVLHLRLVPGFKGKVLFNILGLCSFSSVIMTYFGVNYYLSGLHSYAKGDPLPIPPIVYYSVTIVILLSALAAYNQFRVRKFNP